MSMTCQCASCQALAALDATLAEIERTGKEPSEADYKTAVAALKICTSALESKVNKIETFLNRKVEVKYYAILGVSKK